MADDEHLPSLTELAHDRGGRLRRRAAPPIEASSAALGGKAARLVWLVRHGFSVPEAIVVPTDVFDAVARASLPTGHDVRTLLRLAGTRDGIERAGRAHAHLAEAHVPDWVVAEIDRVWNELRDRAPWGVAVRSSATCEDGALSSLAGLATTHLGVFGRDAILSAMRDVWASLLLPRALSYLSNVGVHHASMGVVVQVVVAATSSGVATATEPSLHERPLDARRPLELSVNATFGLGAPIVGGVSAPDVLKLRVATGPEDVPLEPDAVEIADRTISHKNKALVVTSEGPTMRDVAESQRDQPALSPSSVRALADACARLVRLGPGPWEIEFAFDASSDSSEPWLLQARPVVESGTPQGGDATTVWSCANLAEALPGVATPLTWSVAAQFSELGFRRAFAALGAVVPRGTTFIANVHGRFYLNLTAFTRVAATVPGLDPETLLALGGGQGTELLEEQVQGVSRKGFYVRLPLTAARFVREQARLDSDLAGYEHDAQRARSASEALDLGILTDDGVATTIRDLQRFLDRTGALMLTCASNALGSFVALRALIAHAAPELGVGGSREWATRLAEDLTSGGALKGLGDLESARPTIALVRIAQIALADPPARARIVAAPPPRTLDEIPPGATRDALERWLAAYGDRAIREPELSTPRWREDPSFPLATLALYVSRAERGLSFAPATHEVSARADDAMKKLDPHLSFGERTVLRHLVARSQKFARHRERMRAWVTWVLGALRVAALEADRRLARRDPSLSTGDVFFCTIDEVLAALRGEPRSIGRIVTLRRAEHARDLARPDPPTTFVGRPSPVRTEALGGPVLHGHGASPGVVQGPVRILSSPNEANALRPGEILVTRTTDVGWTPLFLAATGVVTELGGPLSHAAIVARELGVPCVVNANGATFRLRDGDRVRLDGDRGVVEIVPATSDAPDARELTTREGDRP